MILVLSVMTALLTLKTLGSSWVPLILIMTFASGMMTLFTYVSSLAPNEKSKSKDIWTPILILLLAAKPPQQATTKSKSTMKTFSNQALLVLMTLILITFMLAISIQTFNPHQSMNSTF